ncbi:hypothetical protein V5O48_017391 [Marasmius crinis-equi]|uniref:Uncharacterized protein n=1 Tax=Marasmius crinis-equi TaxID=585013 RepID=A0ABR3EP48_9AGAR
MKLKIPPFKTRQGSFYSPYTIENEVTLDALLFAAANRQDDPFGSPLTTPSSSRAPSPETEEEPVDTQPRPPTTEPRSQPEFSEPTPPPTIVNASCSKDRKRTAEQMDDDGDEEGLEEEGEGIEEGSTLDAGSEGSGAGNQAAVGEQSRKKRNKNKNKKNKNKKRKLDPAEDTAASKKRSHKNRGKKRKQEGPASCRRPEELEALAKKLGKRHFKHSEEEGCEMGGDALGDVLESKAASSGYVGNPKAPLGPEKRVYRLDELVNDGTNNFQLIKYKPDCTQPISCKKTKKVMALVVPGPRNDPTWKPNCDAATDRIRQLRPQCKFPEEDDGRRGGINGVGYGMSLGSGQPEPMLRSDQPVRQRKVMELIRIDPAFLRIAGFLSMTFLTWAPLLFLYYANTMSSLLEHYPHLQLPFNNAVWASFAVNFGPQTVCLPHRDSKNLAYGWCAITALGNYNWRKGGHLVLWDLKMVIEFPPGTTIYIPSALVCHFNTAIAPNEERYSFTLYTAGGLFRWVEHGFQFEYDYKKTAQARENAQRDETTWERGSDMFSTVDELRGGFDDS